MQSYKIRWTEIIYEIVALNEFCNFVINIIGNFLLKVVMIPNFGSQPILYLLYLSISTLFCLGKLMEAQMT